MNLIFLGLTIVVCSSSWALTQRLTSPKNTIGMVAVAAYPQQSLP
jgi:hypothetical protein